MPRALMTVLIVIAAGGRASADDPGEGDEVGHFPLLSAGMVGGFDMTPVSFTDSTGAAQTNTTFGAIGGVQVLSDLDTHACLVELEGIANPFGDLRWMTRAHVIFGIRSHAHLVKSISDTTPDSSGYFTRTTEYYVHKYLPIYYGFTAGVSLWGFDTTTWTSYADATDQHSRDPSVVAVIDAGFTIRSPQIELTLAPAYDVAGGNTGLHWAFGMALPIGDHPLYFRFSGDHLFGDDPVDNSGRRTQNIFMMTLGLGSGLGFHL